MYRNMCMHMNISILIFSGGPLPFVQWKGTVKCKYPLLQKGKRERVLNRFRYMHKDSNTSDQKVYLPLPLPFITQIHAYMRICIYIYIYIYTYVHMYAYAYIMEGEVKTLSWFIKLKLYENPSMNAALFLTALYCSSGDRWLWYVYICIYIYLHTYIYVYIYIYLYIYIRWGRGKGH
jgi:hypothetical protein